MAIRLSQSEPGFEARFAAFLASKREVSVEVDDVVRAIIARVRADGDAALVDYTRKFGDGDLGALGIAVSKDDIAAAYAAADAEAVAALTFARDRIAAHHQRQQPADDRYTDPIGVELGSRWTAIEAVGLYVPGGTASYPSSVLMNAVPAKVAGVDRVVIVVPAPEGEINPLVLVAADLAGVSEIYRVGGAQAIAALAYGTETIAPVAKIVGPGNAYVAAAKRQVFGTVGIDMIAGPSEVLVVADAGNDPDWIAADLLAQAEHDAAAQSILITDDARSRRRRRGGGRATAQDAAARRNGGGELARFRRGHHRREFRCGHPADRPHRARASRAGARRRGGVSSPRSAMPARSSSAATRRR